MKTEATVRKTRRVSVQDFVYHQTKVEDSSYRPAKMGQSRTALEYSKVVKISLRAYDAWKNCDNKLDYYWRDNDSQVCLCKTDDQKSCIVVELKVEGECCFVQVRKCKWDPPGGQKETSWNNWNLGTVLSACHSYTAKRYTGSPSPSYTNSSNFASGLVVDMFNKGPSDGTMQMPFTYSNAEQLMRWGKTMGMNLHVFGEFEAECQAAVEHT